MRQVLGFLAVILVSGFAMATPAKVYRATDFLTVDGDADGAQVIAYCKDGGYVMGGGCNWNEDNFNYGGGWVIDRTEPAGAVRTTPESWSSWICRGTKPKGQSGKLTATAICLR